MAKLKIDKHYFVFSFCCLVITSAVIYFLIVFFPKFKEDSIQKRIDGAVQAERDMWIKKTTKPNRSEALSECSTNFAKVVSQPGVLKNVSTLEAQRIKDFLMQVCMESKGYEY